jgi:transcriptional antiterminator NusG
MAKRWYVVHVYSGFEKKIAQQIKEQAAQKGLGDQFDDILVPSEEVTEVRRGQKVNSERKFFPGYVLVKMEMSDEAWHLVKDTPKVTGFLGNKNKPSPASSASRSLGCSTTQTTAWSREVSAQIAHGSASVRLKQFEQFRMRVLTSRMASASRMASSGASLRRWKAMRSAERLPMPGRRASSSISCWMGRV